MRKRIFYWALMVALALLFASPQAMAKGKGKKGDKTTPAGWEKGRKKGWDSDVPPRPDKEATEGLEKKKKEKYKKSKKKAKESKEKAEEEGEDAKKLMEQEREKAEEAMEE